MPVVHGLDALPALRAAVKRMGGETAYLHGIRAGGKAALEVFRRAVENYGYRLAYIVNLFDPEEVLIYSPYSLLGDLFLDPVREVMTRHVESGDLEGLRMRLAGERTPEMCLRAAAVPVLAAAFGHVFPGEGLSMRVAEQIAGRLLP